MTFAMTYPARYVAICTDNQIPHHAQNFMLGLPSLVKFPSLSCVVFYVVGGSTRFDPCQGKKEIWNTTD